MKIALGAVVIGNVLALTGAAAIAPGSAAQAVTARPGDPTIAHVWIQNVPLPVDVRTLPPLTFNASTLLQAHLVRQSWEYKTVSVARGEDPVVVIERAGDGWEVTGVQLATPDGASILLKRPR